MKKISRKELKEIHGGENSVGICLSNESCPSKQHRFVNSPDGGGFQCCPMPPKTPTKLEDSISVAP